MTWDKNLALDLMTKAGRLASEGRMDVAVATYVRAFDVVDRDAPVDPAAAELRSRIASALTAAAAGSAKLDGVVERLARVSNLVVAHAAAPALVRRLALEARLESPSAVEIYLAFLESGRRPEAPVQEAIYRILAKVLRVRSHSRAAQIEPLVPLLRRLMACRPGLDFPRFYLGRCHYLENRFKEARRMLLALQGPLAFDPRVLNMLGRSAEKLGFLDEAAGCYGRSLETDGRQGTIHFRLARLLARQYEQAVFG